MAYNKKELEEQAIDVITKKRLCFIEEAVSYLPCNLKTFYNLKLHELQTIKEAIDKNKTSLKVGLRKKWYESDNGVVQLALYKLICTKEERENLTMNRVDLTNKGEKFVFIDDGLDSEQKLNKYLLRSNLCMFTNIAVLAVFLAINQDVLFYVYLHC